MSTRWPGEEEKEGEGASAVSAETRAAKAIQSCWRSRVSRSIYRYYRQDVAECTKRCAGYLVLSSYTPTTRLAGRNIIDFRLGGDPRLLLRAINPGEAALFDRAAGVHLRFRLGGNIIDFRLGGDPRLLLRAINPGEAALFDRAAGVHLRFRLGGYTFPPCIYYKPPATGYPENLKTGRIRVGASYFGASVKRTGPKGTANWYRRHENNGWRPITIKTLSSAEDDPVTVATAKAPAVRSGDSDGGGDSSGGGFHYSKLVREECRAARMKRRRRRWLMSMHSAGLAEAAAAASSGAGAATSEARSSPPPHAGSYSQHRKQRDEFYYHQERDPAGGGGGAPGWEQGVFGEAEGNRDWPQQGSEDGHDDDGACLVRWSEGLDFDRQVYLSEWRQMATSGPSEPWRNADDFANYVASKGECKTTSGGAGAGTPTAATATATATATSTWAGAQVHSFPPGAKATAAASAATATAPYSAQSTSSSYFSPARSGGGGGGGDRRIGSPGFDAGKRKGGELYDDGQGVRDSGYGVGGHDDAKCPLHGDNGGDGLGGNREGGFTMFDSVGVDLGSV
eukprot:g1611.t1